MIFLANNLFHLRKSVGKRQAEIGKLVGKGGNTIGNWENGQSLPNINEIVMLAEYFDVTLQDLVLTDLSNAMRAAGEPNNKSKYRQYPEPSDRASSVNEDGGNLHWIMLQEVRRNSEKLDELIRAVDKSER